MTLLALVTISACTNTDGADDGGEPPKPRPTGTEALRLTTLSAPSDFISGGDVVVAVDSPAGRSLDDVRVASGDGTNLTDRFAPDPNPHGPEGVAPRLIATLTGLPLGTTTLTATSDGDRATLTLTNHSNDEPLFSGPHQTPFVCTTEQNRLGPPVGQCNAVAPVVVFRYWNQAGRLLDLPAPGEVPADAATATTSEGHAVPFVIRIETTVLNRSITTTAVLDPGAGRSTRSAADDDAERHGAGEPLADWDDSGWNGRLVLSFAGGCGTTYSQGKPSPDVLDRKLLSAGYAIASGSLTTFETTCNATVAAETALRVKEHFVETYGIPRHTIGAGGSGGAIQQLQMTQNYPGILDALGLAAPFPDAVSIAAGASDCGLLERWFGRNGGSAGTLAPGDPSGAAFTNDQQLAVIGFGSGLTCLVWIRGFLDTLDPSSGCDPALADQVFRPETRPRGVRCTFQDSNVNLLGTDPATGFAIRPLDNVGIQYGLQALLDGVINVSQFLALNEHVGGYDINGAWQPARTRASDDALARAYRTGMVTAGTATATTGVLGTPGAGGLADVPVIVQTTYSDEYGDIHDRQRAFAIRDRLRRADGSANPNLAIWTLAPGSSLSALSRLITGGSTETTPDVVTTLDRWLTTAEDDAAAGRSTGTTAERLAAARPDSAGDRCVLPSGEVVEGDATYAPGSPCSVAYPLNSDPRRVAGAPLVADTLACALVAIDPDAYGTTLTVEQLQRLQAVFPDGVCDWNVPGRQQQPSSGSWQSHDQT